MKIKQTAVGSVLILFALLALFHSPLQNQFYALVVRKTSSLGFNAKSHPPPLLSMNNQDPAKHWVEVRWVCPMHPEIVQTHPGLCPICEMQLVKTGNIGTHDYGVRVDNTTVQRLGIRLASIKKGVIGQGFQTYGNIVADESTTSLVQPKYEGWIKKIYVHSPGDIVKAGQVLYEIYSPDLITRERTFLSSIEGRKQLLQTLDTSPSTENEVVMEIEMAAARDRARLYQEEDVSLETIQAIENSKQATDVVKIVAEHSGVVSQLNVKAGSLVSMSTVMMTLTDISQVWIDVPLYPDQAGLVRKGDQVTVHVQGISPIDAQIDFLSPLGESNKVHGRIYLNNRQLHLRPGMFVNLDIHTRSHEALLLPRSAIIYTAQGNMVMLSRGDGHFLPVHVETGVEEGDRVELLDGLRDGAEVAVNGQFLLDAGSTMRATSERMSMQKL